MPVYHFTIHGYRTWRPDHPRGYVRDDGVLPPDPQMAEWYDRDAKFDPVEFDRRIQRVLILGAYDACFRRNWRLHGVGTEDTHVHYAISWRGYIRWSDVMDKLKNVLRYLLGKEIGPRGRKWFTHKGRSKRVTTPEHLEHLLSTYFPDHGGLYWREGMPLPK